MTDDQTATAVLVPVNVGVSTAEFAQLHEVDVRTVKRWLRDERIPAAMQDSSGRWHIPADAAVSLPERKGTRPADVTVSPAPAEPSGMDRLPMLIPIADYARALGTEPGRIKRMAADGLLTIGPYGEHGQTVVVVPPR